MPCSKPSWLIPTCLSPVEYFRCTLPSVEEPGPRLHGSACGPSAAQVREVALSCWCQALIFPALQQSMEAPKSDGWGLQLGRLLLCLHLDWWETSGSWSCLCLVLYILTHITAKVSWLRLDPLGSFSSMPYISSSLFWHFRKLPLPGLRGRWPREGWLLYPATLRNSFSQSH